MSTDLERAERRPKGAGAVTSQATDTGTGTRDDRAGTRSPQALVAWVRRSLFPEFPVARQARPWLARITVLVVAVLAVPVTALRLPRSHWDALWAEDGSTFLQQSLDHPIWRTILTPYAGYIHALPRLATAVVHELPLRYAGVAYTVIAAAVIVWVAWTAYYFSSGHLRSVWLRVVLAAAVVLIPAGGLEATGNVANSHFFLVFGAFWALIGRPRSRLALISAHAMVLLAAMSDPVALGLVPLALLRLVCLRPWRERAVAITYAVGMAVQTWVVLGTQRPGGSAPTFRDVVFGYDFRVVSTSLLSLTRTDALLHAAGPGVMKYVALGAALALAAAALAAPRQRVVILVAGAASVAFFAVACYFSLYGGYPPRDADRLVLFAASRYTILPGMLLLSAWLLAAQGIMERLRNGLRPLVLIVAVAPVVLCGVFDFRPSVGIRGAVQPWSTTVHDVQQACAADPGRQLPFDEWVEPGGQWHVELSCPEVR